MITKIAAWLGSWTLFWMGDAVSRCGCFHNLYIYLMTRSHILQEWGDVDGPWLEPEPEREGDEHERGI